jgi:phosphorylase/glycogen(starch) synthase
MVGQQAPDVILTEQLQLVNVEGNQATYALDIVPNRTGAFDIALCVYPKNENLPYRMDFALVKWA